MLTRATLNQRHAVVDEWLRSHPNLIAAFIVFIGFVLRVCPVARSYLNPDEALHFLLAHQEGVRQVYEASLSNAHPPLFYLLLHFWLAIGDSEPYLRLISVLAATAFLWLGYKWLQEALGIEAGLSALLFFTFSPPLLSLAAEIRAYSVLLLFMASSLYFIERALKEESPEWMALSTFSLYLALLVHYVAFLFAACLAVYVGTRVLREKPRWLFVVSWITCQIGALAILGWLYVSHISQLRGGGMENEAVSGWLQNSYFHPETDHVLLFPVIRTAAVLRYLFGSKSAGVVAILLFSAGVLWCFANRSKAGARLRIFGGFLVLPFVFLYGASVFQLYPFGGSRHNVFLVIFTTAGVSLFLSQVLAKRRVALVGASALFALTFAFSARPPAQSNQGPDWDRALMYTTVRHLRQSVPPGSLVFVDYQTSVLLGYYLGRSQITDTFPSSGFLDFGYGGYRIVASPTWTLDVPSFLTEYGEMKRTYLLDPETPVWVVDAGWGLNLSSELRRHTPDSPLVDLETFGRNISVFRLARMIHEGGG